MTGGEGKGWKSLLMSVWSHRIHESGVKRKLLLSSDHVRSLGAVECFQSTGDQVLQFGVDDSVFFTLTLNELQGVRGHSRVYHRMCEFTHNITETSLRTVTQTDHS